jgi:hypothetical protein
MKINQNELEPKLLEFKVRPADGMCYLLALYYGYKPDYIPDHVKQRVHASGIISVDENRNVTWNINLFEGQKNNFSWVTTEYLELFRHYKKNLLYKRECVARMKNLFRDNPDIRKHEVLGGTAMYIKDCVHKGTNAKYVKNPHYFIKKGQGYNTTQPILTWIELYREEIRKVSSVESLSKSITMQ